MKNLILCGPPGSGKSTVGKETAKILNWTFIDTDLLIEESYAKTYVEELTCRQIYAEEGAKFFREFETQVIVKLVKQDLQKHLISTGGGVIETEENFPLLKSLGKIIYLNEEILELYIRITRNGIPSYLDPNDPYNSFEKLLEKRHNQYRAIADKIVPVTGKSPEELAQFLADFAIKQG